MCARHWFLTVFCLAACAPGSRAYSVLTHEAIIDSAWDKAIVPLLTARYPGATPDQLIEAHAYAYGGCILQDMGYYPLGSKFFSDLVHYARSGDFVRNMIREAGSLDEYAFALGALAHYSADTNGHAYAVNRAVPIMYPKLRRKFGDVITYGENHAAHLKTEFGFDVLQVARGTYAPKAYHDFIGFKVAKGVLERAFKNTYGLKLSDVFVSVDLALGTYRRSVSSILPEATRVAWQIKKDEIVKSAPRMTRRRFIYNVSRASYEKEWGREYRRPGAGARVLAWFFRVLPKVGPFRAVAFKTPNQQTALLFEDSFNLALDKYRLFLKQSGAGELQLPNLNFDTGQLAHAGEYALADDTYAELVRKLEDRKFAGVTPALRADILQYYGSAKPPAAAKKKEDQWHKTVLALDKLKAFEPAPIS